MSHKGSPKGYTDSQRIHIWQGTDTYDINRGYGWNDGGYWQTGEHWVEIYLNGVKVATQNFTVE